MNEAKYREAESQLWEFYGCEPSESLVSLAATGTDVRVQEVGEGDPILLIHGGPNSGSTWAPIVGRLEGFRCLIVDRPGTGLSEPYPVTAQNLAEFGASFVGSVLDGLEIDRAHVVASSFGGHLALRSAASHPERFLRMVQMASPAAVPGETFPSFMKSLKSPIARAVMNAMPPSRRINRSIMRQLGHGASLDAGRFPDTFFDWYLALGRHTETMRNDARMIGGEIMPNIESLKLSEELLGSVTTPTLFLWGADDGFGRESNARMLTSFMPHADLVMMPEAGHLPWLDDPGFAARRTAEFLASSTEAVASEPDLRIG